MQVDIININGEKTGRSMELPEEIFGMEPNDHVIYLAVKQYRSAQRQGTHKVKTRMEVKGASRKLVKQKGTGGARKGNLRSPIYKGGGSIFGPKPHRYDTKLNRKVKDLAKISALAYKAKENAIVIMEDVILETPKTKAFSGLLKSLNIGKIKALFVIPEYNDNIYLSLRNVVGINGSILSDMNTYDILDANVLVMTEKAARLFTEVEESAN